LTSQGFRYPRNLKTIISGGQRKRKKKKTEEDFFATETKKKVIDPQRIADQKEFDKSVLAIVKQVPLLVPYLNAKFSLHKNEYPHALKF